MSSKLYLVDIVGKKNYAKDPVLSDHIEILESTISSITIVIRPLFSAEKRKKCQPLIDEAPNYPHRLSFSNYTHACFVAKVEHNGEYTDILVEYGQYDQGREGDYKAQVHYFYEVRKGLRFIKLTDEDAGKIFSHDSQIIPCSVTNHITVEQLLFDSQFCGKFHMWSFEKYDLGNQNCQLFVRKIVHILGAKRIEEEMKTKEYTVKYIPLKVSSALEDNENNRKPNIRGKLDKSKINYFSKLLPNSDHVVKDSDAKFLLELLKKYDELIYRTIY